jgi:hypothetical protein
MRVEDQEEAKVLLHDFDVLHEEVQDLPHRDNVPTPIMDRLDLLITRLIRLQRDRFK